MIRLWKSGILSPQKEILLLQRNCSTLFGGLPRNNKELLLLLLFCYLHSLFWRDWTERRTKATSTFFRHVRVKLRVFKSFNSFWLHELLQDLRYFFIEINRIQFFHWMNDEKQRNLCNTSIHFQNTLRNKKKVDPPSHNKLHKESNFHNWKSQNIKIPKSLTIYANLCFYQFILCFIGRLQLNCKQ